MVNYDNIPEELKKLHQWVCAYEGSKTPMKAWENEAASSTNPRTWSDFPSSEVSQETPSLGYLPF